MFGDPAKNNKNMSIVKLSDMVCLLRNGANIKQGKTTTGIPITRIETIANRTVDRSRMGYAGIFDPQKYDSYILQDNDILMSHINSIKHMGKSAIYHKKDDEVIIHGMNLLCLRPKQSIVNPIYLYQYFQSDYFYDQVLSITKPAVNQASMTTTDLGALCVILPPIKKQNQFASFVEQTDKSKFAVHLTGSNLNLSRCLEIP